MSLSSSPFHGFLGMHCTKGAEPIAAQVQSSLWRGLKFNKILKFFKKFVLMLRSSSILPPLYIHIFNGEKVYPKKMKGSLEEKEEPVLDFRQAVQHFNSSC